MGERGRLVIGRLIRSRLVGEGKLVRERRAVLLAAEAGAVKERFGFLSSRWVLSHTVTERAIKACAIKTCTLKEVPSKRVRDLTIEVGTRAGACFEVDHRRINLTNDPDSIHGRCGR